jgi:thymidylate synthase
MKEGFPLLTSKKMAWKAMVIELLWFLKGDTNIKYLVDNGCMIWVGDALKNFNKHIDEENDKMSSNPLLLYQPKARWSREEFIEKIKTDNEFAEKWGELGPVYGKQWRSWRGYCNGGSVKIESKPVDQIQNLIKDLKENPDSRRLMVNAWNVGEIDEMVLPPCHYGFQCYTRELTTEERNKWYFNTAYQNPKYKVDWKDYELDQQNIPTKLITLEYNQEKIYIYE